MILYLLLTLAVILVVGAVLSAAETALVIVSSSKLNLKKNQMQKPSALLRYYRNDPEKFHLAFLFALLIVQVAVAGLVLVFIPNSDGFNPVEYLVISLIIFYFVTLLPKLVTVKVPERILRFTSIPAALIVRLISPLTFVMAKVLCFTLRQGKIKPDTFKSVFDLPGQNSFTETPHAGITSGPRENLIINRVLRLRKQKVMEAMRPRTEVVGLDINSTVDEALAVFVESGFSKIPLFEENVDHIVGIVLAYDLFKNPASLREVMREVLFVPEARKSIDMLNDFLNRGISFAVVVDEFGGTAGIITREDIIEELYGEIKDEYDVDEDICRRINDSTYLINGKIEVDFINEQFNLGLPKGDYETISGFITARVGRIPANNEDLQINNFNLHIVRSTPVRVELVKLTVPKD